MDWWNLAPYWVPGIVAVITIVILAAAAVRSRAARRSARKRRTPLASVDPFYLDSSHMGEP